MRPYFSLCAQTVKHVKVKVEIMARSVTAAQIRTLSLGAVTTVKLGHTDSQNCTEAGRYLTTGGVKHTHTHTLQCLGCLAKNQEQNNVTNLSATNLAGRYFDLLLVL